MNTEQSYRLLRMCYSLLKMTDFRHEPTQESVARDLYDFVEQYTTDKTLKLQMEEARKLPKSTRFKSLLYLNHRLNIGFN